jgi:hypothetical protein
MIGLFHPSEEYVGPSMLTGSVVCIVYSLGCTIFSMLNVGSVRISEVMVNKCLQFAKWESMFFEENPEILQYLQFSNGAHIYLFMSW